MQAKISERKLNKYSVISLAEFAAYVAEMTRKVDAGEMRLDDAIGEVVITTEGF